MNDVPEVWGDDEAPEVNNDYEKGWDKGFDDGYDDGRDGGLLEALEVLQRVYKRLEKGGELRRGDVEALMDEIRSKCAP